MAGVGRPQERVLCLGEGEREELERISRSHSAPHSVVRRAQIILASADGETNTAIARRLGTTNPTVCHWRKRWFEQGLVGLYGEARPGRPRTHDEERVAQLLRTVLESKPADGTHWTVRSAAQATGISKTTVGRMLALFVDKVKDIVGLYLNPPDHAVVLCVDEKTQRSWLSRPRFHIHYTPTYASWLNQVERWFALLTERQIRRASFVSAKDLVEKIDAFVQAYNIKAKPFVWTATSEAILEKVERLCKAICRTGQ